MWIDAVNLAFAFELTEQFPPALLLESYLVEARKVSSSVRSGNTSTAQNDPSEKELNALKAVIKCIEDNKLENHYPPDPLHKRVTDLEKAKADKKRATEVAKPHSKRPRANAMGHGPRAQNTVSVHNFYANNRFPQYGPTYTYAAAAPAHAYAVAPGHGNFFGNGFQYQTAFLH